MTKAERAGTTPPGTHDEQQAAGWVRGMFSNIAPQYDFVNHLLSFNIDRGWRKQLLAELAPVLAKPAALILDLCCGTGDVLLALRNSGQASVLGADFSHPMLVEADRKSKRVGRPALLLEGDALDLPLAGESLDAISIAFGFRNLANYRAGLEELTRVLKPGGTLAILEFSHPPGRFTRFGYGLYSRWLLPLVGGLISGSLEAYTYLPDSIRKFPRAEELRQMMEESGFRPTRYQLLTGGIAALHIGVKSAPVSPTQPPVDLVPQI